MTKAKLNQPDCTVISNLNIHTILLVVSTQNFKPSCSKCSIRYYI